MTETAPKWALCSDCYWSNKRTCPEQPQCWAPTATADLPDTAPSFGLEKVELLDEAEHDRMDEGLLESLGAVLGVCPSSLREPLPARRSWWVPFESMEPQIGFWARLRRAWRDG